MSKRYELEVLPPERNRLPSSDWQDGNRDLAVAAPDMPTGPIESALTRWRANRQTRTWDAHAATMRAAQKYYDAQHAALESYYKCQETAYRIETLSERMAGDVARQQAERAEALRQIERRRELAEMHHVTELTAAEAKLTEAVQVLRVQHELGLQIAQTRRRCELLDVQMAAAEREAILRQHLNELEAKTGIRSSSQSSDDLIDEALHQMRANLNASGADATHIDSLISQRRSGR